MPQVVDVVALSPTQAGMVTTSLAEANYDPYLVTIALDLAEMTPILLSRLPLALEALCRRHPHLVGRVRSKGLPHPVLLVPDAGHPAWEVHDLRAEPAPMATAQQYRATEGNRPLSLSDGPLIRATLLHLAGDDDSGHFVLLLTLHHLVIDGWCMPRLFEEFIALVKNGEAELEPSAPLRNYAAWLADQNPTVAKQKWLDELNDLEDMPRLGRGIRTDGAPVVGEHRIGTVASGEIAAYAREHKLTLATLAQLAWARVLSSATGRDDVVFGNTSSGRHPEIPDGDRIIGGLVTTTPVRVRVDDRPPNEVGAELQSRIAELRRHDWLGSSGVSQAVGAGGRELFDSLVVVENTPAQEVQLSISLGDGASARLLRVDSPSHYPVTIVIVEDVEIVVRAECYDTEIPDSWAFADPTRTARRVAEALVDLVSAPSLAMVSILLPDESDHLAGAEGRVDLPAYFDQVVQEVAARTPYAQALSDIFGELDFQGFQSCVSALAATLRQAGLKPGEPVAVALPRDRRAVIAPFAIAAARGITVHLDPTQPVSRMSQMIADAGCTLVLTDTPTTRSLSQVADHLRCGIPDPSAVGQVAWQVFGSPVPGKLPIATDNRPIAYVVFTSGSTGRAKGVAVSHGALLNYWSHHDHHILGPTQRTLGRPLRVAHAWSTGFDAAWQPQVALLSGHSVHIMDEETRNDPEKLVHTLKKHQIDMIDTTPSMVVRLLAAGLAEAESHLSVLALGGEVIPQDLWNQLRCLGITVWNCYGPTEATVECFMARVAEHLRPTIGTPLDGMSAAVLDHRLRPLPAGMSGQLALWGAQLAEGYVGRDMETAAAFRTGADGLKRYLTGDRARRTAEGTVIFEGRCDEQVKINGYRVEPEEVAAALRSLPDVFDACVVVEENQGRPYLGAVVVTKRDATDVRRMAALRLPSYLLPRLVAVVPQLPVTHNGKLDRIAIQHHLQEAQRQEPHQAVQDMTPQLEDLLAAVSSMTGNVPSPSSRFDDLGLDSIALMDLVASLRAPSNGGRTWQVSVRDLVESPCIADAALRMTQLVTNETDSRNNASTFVLTRLAQAYVSNSGDALASMAQSQLVALPDEHISQLRLMIESLLEALVTAHPNLAARIDDSRTKLVGDGLPPLLNIVPADLSLPQARDSAISLLNPWLGPLCVASIRPGVPGKAPVLLLTVHHLAVDVASWHILAEDIKRFGQGLEIAPESPVPADSGAVLNHELPDRVCRGPALVARHCNPRTDIGTGSATWHQATSKTTAAVLEMARIGLGVDDILGVVTGWTDREFAAAYGNPIDDELWYTIEVHGREGLEECRAVGWYTAELTRRAPAPAVLNRLAVTQTVAISREDRDALAASCLNYLGRMDLFSLQSDASWQILSPRELLSELDTPEIDELPARFSVTVTAHVEASSAGPVLVTSFAGARGLISEEQVKEYASRWLCNLAQVTYELEETP